MVVPATDRTAMRFTTPKGDEFGRRLGVRGRRLTILCPARASDATSRRVFPPRGEESVHGDVSTRLRVPVLRGAFCGFDRPRPAAGGRGSRAVTEALNSPGAPLSTTSGVKIGEPNYGRGRHTLPHLCRCAARPRTDHDSAGRALRRLRPRCASRAPGRPPAIPWRGNAGRARRHGQHPGDREPRDVPIYVLAAPW